jgi:hypothetical protein
MYAVGLIVVPAGLLLDRAPLPGSARIAVSACRLAALVLAMGAYWRRAAKLTVPSPEPQHVRVDARGIHVVSVNECPLALRSEIIHAYIRPAREASKLLYFANQASATVTFASPAWPVTVEIVTTGERLNLAVRDEEQAGSLLRALGFPTVIRGPEYYPMGDLERRMARRTWLILALAALLASALFGGGMCAWGYLNHAGMLPTWLR